jgi:hypothetical protein
MGIPMCLPIPIHREKGKVNASLLDGIANVPPNYNTKRERQGQCLTVGWESRCANQFYLKKKEGKVNASLLDGNADKPPNSVSKRERQC